MSAYSAFVPFKSQHELSDFWIEGTVCFQNNFDTTEAIFGEGIMK